MIIDLYLVYNFLKRLATPFKEWEAYKLGIIDERGNILRKRRELRLKKERDAFGVFDVLVLNLKRLLEKVPGGQSRLASYAAALYLIREWNHFSDESLLTEDITDEQLSESIDLFYDRYVNYIQLPENVNKKVDLNELFEEKFSDELNEVFDKPYPYDLDIKDVTARAWISLPDRTRIMVSFMKKPGGIWDVLFERNGSMDVTGKGDQYKVFATVIAVIKDFVEKVQPKKITFSADKTERGDSRSNLYNRMLKRFAKKTGYSFTSKEGIGETNFTLMKEEAPTMNVGSGNIAGLGVGPQGEPGLTPAQMKRYKKKNKGPKRLRDVVGKMV